MLKECVEHAFGTDADEQVPLYLQEQELSDCSNDTMRWYGLYDKCDQWLNEFMLWERHAYVAGIHGWNLEIYVCELRLPKEPADWTEYLYRMTALASVRSMGYEERKHLADAGCRIENFLFAMGHHYCVESGYWSLTREQWLDEVTDLLAESKRRFNGGYGTGRDYRDTVTANYPILEYALGYLSQNVEDCEVVRLNRHGGDETVWYFAKAKDRFYLMFLSDSM